MADEVNENIFLVNAPAGSGKTTWIRQQVESYLLHNPKDNILCITYTNRAAEELGRDLEQSRVYFGTIHSFINDFIGSFFSHKEIIDLYWEVYETQIIERIRNIEQKKTWIESNERYKEKYGSLDLDIVRSNINKISYNETPFNSLLYGGLGHNDLITFTKLAVDRFPIIKKKISDKYQLIFIDEYQDTSADVLHIFYTSLVGKKSKLYLLGDKMQQIYKNYNGEFEEKLETFNRSVNLSINYRTTPKIVDILNYIYNDEALKQYPYEKNSNNTMAFSPKVLIVNDVEKAVIDFRKSYEDALFLYVSNRARFYDIVKTWSRDNDRYEVAMHTVGSGLSYAELDEDKLPQTAVIEELNRVENEELRRGYYLGIINQRGVHWIDPEGKPELELAEDYENRANIAESRGYSRYAGILRVIGDEFKREARRNALRARNENDDIE